MKKIILSIFLLTLFPCVTYAATSCPSDATLESCSINPGCYWNTTTGTCTLCPAGTYNIGGSSNKNKTACTSCGTLNGERMDWASTTGLESANNCIWNATCEPGEYFANKSTGCQSCSDLGSYYGPNQQIKYYGNGNLNNNTIYIADKKVPGTNTTLSLVTNIPSGQLQHWAKFCLSCSANTDTKYYPAVTDAEINAAGTNCDCPEDYHKENADNCETSAHTNLQSINWDTIFANWNDYLTCLDATKTCSNQTIKDMITPKKCVLNTYTITLNHNSNDTRRQEILYTIYDTNTKDNTSTSYDHTIVITDIPLTTTEFLLPDSEEKIEDGLHAKWDPNNDKFVRQGYNLKSWTAPYNGCKDQTSSTCGASWDYDPSGFKCGPNSKYPQLQQSLTAQWVAGNFNITYKICDDQNIVQNTELDNYEFNIIKNHECTYKDGTCHYLAPYQNAESHYIGNPGTCLCRTSPSNEFHAGTKYSVAYILCESINAYAEQELKDDRHTIDTTENENFVNSCTSNKDCTIPHMTEVTPVGVIFTGWKCTYDNGTKCDYGCDDPDATDCIIKPGTNIKGNTKNITLTAKWELCPAGYYCPYDTSGNCPVYYDCPAVTAVACPVGTTSDQRTVSATTENADKKHNCYMLGGTTKIHGTNGTFTLPAGLKLYYQDS